MPAIDKAVVAEHEAAHGMVALKSCIRERLEYIRLNREGDEPLGECKFNYQEPEMNARDRVARFAVSLAGPLHQMLMHRDSIPAEFVDAFDREGTMLNAYSWLIKNVPDLEFNWGTDFVTWRSFLRRCTGFDPKPFFMVEEALTAWFGNDSNNKMVTELSLLCIEKGTLRQKELLEFDVSQAEEIVLPAQLTVFDRFLS